MHNSFEMYINYLINNSWELVWSTSSYVEVYCQQERITEGRIESLGDTVNFINSNKLI